MNRQALPLLAPAAAWVAGLSLARGECVSWTGVLLLACLSAAIALLSARRGNARRALPCLLFFLFALVYGGASLALDGWRAAYGSGWTDAPIVLRGTLASRLDTRFYTRLTLKDVVRDDGVRLHGLVRLYVHDAHRSPVLLAGDAIRVRARLHAPRNHHNPGGFDFAAYCFDRHIALVGSAVGPIARSGGQVGLLEKARQRIRQALRRLPSADGGVLRAILLGERGDIPQVLYDAFTATGAAHLLAISGLHVGMAAAFGFALAWWAATRREDWIVRYSVRRIALMAGLVFALAYATLAGWPLPTRRAVLMLGAAALAWLLRARASPLNTLLAALMLMLAFDPSAVSSLSLWLSFVATAGILLWAGKRSTRDEGGVSGSVLLAGLKGLGFMTVIAALATLPLVASSFGRLPLYGVPVNLLMTPLYTLFVLPLALFGAGLAACGLDAAAHALLALAGDGVAWGNRLIMAVVRWPGGDVHLPAVPWWLNSGYGIVLALCMLRWRAGRRAHAAMLLCAGVAAFALLSSREHPPAEPRFIVWDVGQGAAATLVLPDGFVFSMDAPGRPGSRFNGGAIVAEGLRGMGLTHADVLAVSHAQSDHLGGMLTLVRRLNHVGELWLADAPQVRRSPAVAMLVEAVRRRGGRVRWLSEGMRLRLPQLSARILWPPAEFASPQTNNTSLTMRLTLADGMRLLLPGDIEAAAEAAMLSRERPHLAADVLLLPHHGSRTSSTPDFVRAVHPSLAVAQTGFGNRYRFPAAEVLDRYAAVGSRLENTADGAVAVRFPRRGGGMRASVIRTPEAVKRKRALQWWRQFL